MYLYFKVRNNTVGSIIIPVFLGSLRLIVKEKKERIAFERILMQDNLQ